MPIIKKLTIFYHVFWKSISSFSYYQDVIKAPFSFSLKYFWFFSITFALLLSGILSFIIAPSTANFVSRFEKRAPNLYPTDLVITVKDGILSTNVEKPLKFPLPVELFMETPGAISDQQQQYMLTIDTSLKEQDYTNSDSLILITQKSIIIPSDTNYRVYPLSDLDNTTITKTTFDAFLQSTFPILRLLPIIIVIGLFVILALLIPLSRLISLLFLSLILMIAAKFLRLSLPFSKLFQIGLHALTLPTLIQVAMISLRLESPIPFFNSILFILYALVILAELKKPTNLQKTKSSP